MSLTLKGLIKIRIIADSSCDLNDELKERLQVKRVPLTITLGETHYRDDEQLDVSKLLDDIDAYPGAAKSACPSPQDFMDAFSENGSVFVVTMTAALSGTYNSAMVARDNFLQEQAEKFIHVFNSKGSSIKETLIVMKIRELIDMKLSELEIVEKVNEYLAKQKYFFQLGNLDTMIKNGRVPKLKGMIANALNIKPILYGDDNGEVALYANVRGEKKSIKKMVDLIGEHCEDFKERVLGIAHCEAFDKVVALKAAIEERYNFKEIVVVPMQGLSSTYTNRGGITLAF